MLSSSQLIALQEIRDSSYETLLKGRDSNGVPFLKNIFEIYFKLFGEVCSNCPAKISGYIKKLKNYKSLEKMADKKTPAGPIGLPTSGIFRLKTGVVIPIPGTSNAYSNENITDDVALLYISQNINRRIVFDVLPENLEAYIAKYLDKNIENKYAKIDNNDNNDNLIFLRGYIEGIEIKTVKLALRNSLGITLKAKSVATTLKFLGTLSEEDTQTFRIEVSRILENQNSGAEEADTRIEEAKADFSQEK